MRADWKVKAKTLPKEALACHDINNVELAERLEDIDINETPQNLARGTFSAAFLLKALEAIECKQLQF
ncbi:DUF6471 domain-containing protein [Eilatimonas milleporae]|uniref:DUF6471 domain-containing protein n=1 Tax=Eilatimonas milleporae TaxID=911205 RepID=A0A3M0CME5_9PROT|nr:DUF6471 domain-containing protein [Eilatimonas milleporae]RMB08106.1 hypothetical protein BXY39_2202 [Eilatimonas milleporae]